MKINWETLVTVIGEEDIEDILFLDKLKPEFERQVKTLKKQQCTSNYDAGIDVLDQLHTFFKNDELEINANENSKQQFNFEDSLKDWLREFCRKHIERLEVLFDPIFDAIADGCSYVVTEDDRLLTRRTAKKAEKKVVNASRSYAYPPSSQDVEKEYRDHIGIFIALFDTTAFGSAEEGIFITSESISWKGLMEDRMFFYLNSIETIRVRDDELIINSERHRFFHSEIKWPLTKSVEVIEKYRNQPAYKLLRWVNSHF